LNDVGCLDQTRCVGTPVVADIRAVRPPRRRQVPRWVSDALIAVMLGLVAFAIRLNLPSDGLFHDDAWQVFAVARGGFSDFPTIGQMQPGYTVGLLLWERAFGSGTASMVAPALIAGALAPPALYLVLRRLGHARTVSLLLSAMLVVSSTHILFSDRVKTYTGDVLVVLLLIVLVPSLGARKWSYATATGWLVGAVLISSFSPFALLSSIAAGIILALHPNGDRGVRLVATGAQLGICTGLVLIEMRTFNARALRGFWSGKDAFIDIRANPLHVVRDVVQHSMRVVAVFPGGGAWWGAVVIVIATLGIVMMARGGRDVVLGRFLALVLLLAVFGSVAHRVPFGARASGDGGRVALWLTPVVAVGVAAVLERARSVLANRPAGRFAFDAVAVAAVAGVFVSALGGSYAYPNEGARAASRAVMAELAPRDAVWITRSAFYPFALQSGATVHLRATPDRIVGLLPAFADPRLHLVDFETTTSELVDSLTGVNRVFVLNAGGAGSPRYADYLAKLALTLSRQGFVHARTEALGRAHVDTWRRRAAD
jgi:hypothetical protein